MFKNGQADHNAPSGDGVFRFPGPFLVILGACYDSSRVGLRWAARCPEMDLPCSVVRTPVRASPEVLSTLNMALVCTPRTEYPHLDGSERHLSLFSTPAAAQLPRKMRARLPRIPAPS